MSTSWKTLPTSQKLLGLSLALMVFVLPLALFSIGSTQNLQKKAAASDHPLAVFTPYVSLQADDFYVEYQGQQYYFFANALTYMGSAPQTEGTSNETSIQFNWDYNGHHLGLNKYFQQSGGTWTETQNVLEIDNKTFRDNITPINGPLGQSVTYQSLTENYINPVDSNDTASITTSNYVLHPFIYRLEIPTTSTGYFLEMQPAGSSSGFINIPANPDIGFGYSAVLRNAGGSIVTDQTGFVYSWSIDDPSIASVTPNAFCLWNIQQPCPYLNGLVKGLSDGTTTLRVSVSLNNEVVASGSIGVVIGPYIFITAPTPTPTLPAACPTFPNPACQPDQQLWITPAVAPGQCGSYVCGPNDAITPGPSPTNTPELSCTGRRVGREADFNNDDTVDISDYAILIYEYLKDLPQYQADANCDGKVDINDYAWLIYDYLK